MHPVTDGCRKCGMVPGDETDPLVCMGDEDPATAATEPLLTCCGCCTSSCGALTGCFDCATVELMCDGDWFVDELPLPIRVRLAAELLKLSGKLGEYAARMRPDLSQAAASELGAGAV